MLGGLTDLCYRGVRSMLRTGTCGKWNQAQMLWEIYGNVENTGQCAFFHTNFRLFLNVYRPEFDSKRKPGSFASSREQRFLHDP